MLFKNILLILFAAAILPASEGRRQGRPESSLQIVSGQLALGRFALGMTVPEAEALHNQPLRLRPNVDDTGQCTGLEGEVLVDGNRVMLTFTRQSEILRLQAMFVRFAEVRDLDTVAAEVKRRVPSLRVAERDPLVKGNKSFWELPTDTMQTLIIGVTEGLWISRGCANGLYPLTP